MLDFDRLRSRFAQFGGWRLVWQYARMGVLWTGVWALMRCALKGVSMKAAYPVITKKVDERLILRYRHILDDNKRRLLKDRSEGDGSKDGDGGLDGYAVPKIVWLSWLQGMDKAPEVVRVCLASQKRHLPGYEFRTLDLDNYRQWVELPDYVVEKYKKGLIPQASFSDLLRLAVLKRYGGIWMDATVFCSGFGNEKLQARWDRIMRSEFMVFRYFRRGEKAPVGLSNWFIAAVPNQIIVSSILDIVLAYWKDYDCLVDYYIFHLFLGLALHEFPAIEAKMPRENSFHSIMLGDALARTFRQEQWQDLIDHVSIHKFNFRKVEEALKNPHSYCAYMVAQRL